MTFFSRVVKTGLTSFSGSDRTRALIFVRFGEVDVFGKSVKRVVFFSFFVCLSSLPNKPYLKLCLLKASHEK